MKTPTLIIGLAVIALVAGGIYYWSDVANAPEVLENGAASPTPSPTPPPTQGGVSVDVTVGEPDAFVTYSDSGFSPSTVTVTKGQKVRFINNSNRDFWPASAIHPTHAIYPEKKSADCLGSSFDACKATAPGETWEFAFTQVGTWRYHDHLSSSRTGTVVVTE